MRRALLGLKHPKLKARNFVELGMIPDVRVEDGRVVVTLALRPADSGARAVPADGAGHRQRRLPRVAGRRGGAGDGSGGAAAFSACAEGRAPAVGHEPAVHSVVPASEKHGERVV